MQIFVDFFGLEGMILLFYYSIILLFYYLTLTKARKYLIASS